MALIDVDIKVRLYRDSFGQTYDSQDSYDSQQPYDGQAGETRDIVVAPSTSPVTYRTS